MFLGLLTLLTALVISSVAIYYSVSGLAAIFAGAAVPIIIMGASLEVGKLVTASWLHRNWKTAPFVLKSYLAIATLILMFITSMGIFGFLSRAHVEQGAPVGDISNVIETIDEKIAAKKLVIEQAKTSIKNMDNVVSQFMEKGKDERSVAAAANARRSQQKERDKAGKEIDDAQKEIQKLQEQKIPLSQQVRKIETEVGPIKYIAQFIYNDKPNPDMLEKAVTWMILTIIFVFDPLAVLLLIAGQISLIQAAERRKQKKEEKQQALKPTIIENLNIVEPTPPPPPQDLGTKTVEVVTINKSPVAKKKLQKKKPIKKIEKMEVKPDPLTEWNNMIEAAEQALYKEQSEKVEPVAAEPKVEPKIAYIQNSEQGENTLWQRVQANRKIFKPMDILYSEYHEHGFKDIDLSNQDQSDPEIQILIKYVNDIKNDIIKFDDIPQEHREKLAELITSEPSPNSNLS